MKLHHLGIAVKDINSSLQHYNEALYWKTSSEIIHDPIQKVYVCFMFDINGIRYELIQPNNENSPVGKLLNRRISIYHICYEINNMDHSISDLTAKGFLQISSPVKAIAFNGRRIVFLINRDNLIIELLEKNT